MRPLLFALLLAVMPLKNWAQTPYRQYADEGILLNAYEIDNVGFRVSGLTASIKTIGSKLSPMRNLDNSASPQATRRASNLSEAFETFYRKTYADFSLLTKDTYTINELLEKLHTFHVLLASMMMDITSEIPHSNRQQPLSRFRPFLCFLDVTLPLTLRPLLKTADDLEGTTSCKMVVSALLLIPHGTT